jgi:hypothetical protein
LKCMDEINSKIVMLDEKSHVHGRQIPKAWNIWMNMEHEWTFGW